MIEESPRKVPAGSRTRAASCPEAGSGVVAGVAGGFKSRPNAYSKSPSLSINPALLTAKRSWPLGVSARPVIPPSKADHRLVRPTRKVGLVRSVLSRPPRGSR